MGSTGIYVLRMYRTLARMGGFVRRIKEVIQSHAFSHIFTWFHGVKKCVRK